MTSCIKKNIVFLGLLAALSCSEREGVGPADVFIGTWFGELSGQGVHIDVSFEVSYEKDGYTFKDITLDYAKVPWTIVPGEDLTYSISPKDKFAANDGFGQIDVWGNSETMWVLVRLKGTKIIENNGGWTTPGGVPIDKSIPYVMTVSEVSVEKMNTNPIILEDQVLMRVR